MFIVIVALFPMHNSNTDIWIVRVTPEYRYHRSLPRDDKLATPLAAAQTPS